MSTSTIATNRLAEERKNWRKDHPPGFHARPCKREDNSFDLMRWETGIPGKDDTDWADGVYVPVFPFRYCYYHYYHYYHCCCCFCCAAPACLSHLSRLPACMPACLLVSRMSCPVMPCEASTSLRSRTNSLLTPF